MAGTAKEGVAETFQDWLDRYVVAVEAYVRRNPRAPKTSDQALVTIALEMRKANDL